MADAADDRRVCLGVVTGAHGVQGLVRIKSFTADAQDIASYGPLEDEHGERRFAVELKGAVKGVLLAKLPGVADRNAAEALKGVRLYVRRSALPAPDEEEYYHADLVGLAAEQADGAALGEVRAVFDHGAGTHLEVGRPGERTVLVPFTRAAVPVVDLTARRVVIVLPEELVAGAPEAAEDEVVENEAAGEDQG